MELQWLIVWVVITLLVVGAAIGMMCIGIQRTPDGWLYGHTDKKVFNKIIFLMKEAHKYLISTGYFYVEVSFKSEHPSQYSGTIRFGDSNCIDGQNMCFSIFQTIRYIYCKRKYVLNVYKRRKLEEERKERVENIEKVYTTIEQIVSNKQDLTGALSNSKLEEHEGKLSMIKGKTA